MNRVAALIGVFLPALVHSASFDPSTFVNATNTINTELVALVGLGADLHSYETSMPHSSKIGADFGPTITAIVLPGSATKALTDLGVKSIPRAIPLPKFNIQKAINRRLLIGTEFMPTVKAYGYSFSSWGVNAQFTIINRPRLPPIALRAQYNDATLAFVRARTIGTDLLVTYDLLFIDIYAGGGYRNVQGAVSNPTGTFPQMSGVDFEPGLDAGHFFGGVSTTAGFFRITAEANFTTRNVSTYGAKLSLVF